VKIQIFYDSHLYLYSIVLGEGKSPSCYLVVLPNKFAFEENKLINLGMVVSMTVFFYLPQQIWIFFCLSLELELFPFDCSETHWDIDSAQ
jgi:hypothetical protein